MNIPLRPEGPGSSTRPYLIRALHDWCTDNGYTPYLAVFVDATVQVPVEFVKNQEIVLNTSFEATSGLELGNEVIRFKARFGGVPREIVVPVDHVLAIYARENGQGMAFPAPAEAGVSDAMDAEVPSDRPDAPPAAEPPAAAPSPATPGLRLAPRGGTPRKAAAPAASEPPPEPPPASPGRPALKRIK